MKKEYVTPTITAVEFQLSEAIMLDIGGGSKDGSLENPDWS